MPPRDRLATDSTPQTLLLSWDRASVGPDGIAGLWSAGFIVNRDGLNAQLDIPAPISDLDLAVALYKRWGNDAPRRIHGPFAWIVWDGDRQRLMAVRDRVGIHEIFYRQERNAIHLAGSIEPVLEASRPHPAVNPFAVLAQIHGRVPTAGETFYEGIGAVAPGQMLTVTRDRIASGHYWRPELQPLHEFPDDAAYGQAFRELFLPIVAEYTPAREVGVGVTLSGGLDSTTVAAAIIESLPGTDLTAFSWISPELPEADESEAVAAVCRQLGCRVVTIAADHHWPLRTEPGIRPEAATPFFNFYTDLWDATFRAVREQGVRTLFSGVSGDNLFGADVFSYPDLLLTGRWRRLVSEIRDHRKRSRLSTAQIVRWLALAPIANTYIPTRDRDRTQPVAWLGSRFQQVAIAAPKLSRRVLPGRRERLRMLRDPWLAVTASLVTKQAARHGIDFRHPLLDHRLFDFAAGLPTTQTFAAGKRKVILRNAMRGRLPEAVLDQWGKTYPEAIARRGLREREQAKVWALMTNMRAAEMGFVDERRLREAYSDYLAGRDPRALFWNTLTLEAWLRRYFS